jgi:hypothetical protein
MRHERRGHFLRLGDLAITFALLTGVAVPGPIAVPSADSVRGWVRDLDDDRFEVREAASRKLVQAGRQAIPAAAEAAGADSLEVASRAIAVLRSLSVCTDGDTAAAATAALERLAASKNTAAAPARRALLFRQHEAARALLRCGARIDISPDSPVTVVGLDEAELTPRTFALLRALPELEDLSLGNPRMDDAGMSELRGLTMLQSLNLYRSGVGDDGLKVLKGLPALRRVPMGETKVTDAGLVHLRDLEHLEYVGLRGDRVTDAGLVHLRSLKNLTGLHLGETQVTDAGLIHLRALTRLSWLTLAKTKVTDAGLSHFNGMRGLKSLDLSGTAVTEAGTARLRRLLPGAQVVTGPP